MKFLGNILHVSNSGRLIAKSSQSPPSGASVFNKNKKKIGKIVDVFGPTKEPYISIGIFKSINSESFKNSSGEDLFVSENPKNKKRNRNSKNNKRDNKYKKYGDNNNSNKSNKHTKYTKHKKHNKDNLSSNKKQ